MNIFMLDLNLRRNAMFYCDQRLVKIILEITQMLWTAYGNQEILDLPANVKRYKMTHAHHPMTLWIKHQRSNFQYAAQLGLALCEEYSLRFFKRHACEVILEWLKTHPPCKWGSTYASTTTLAKTDNPKGVSPLPLCMPVQYRSHSLIASYRHYFRSEKREKARWRYTPQPHWLHDSNTQQMNQRTLNIVQ